MNNRVRARTVAIVTLLTLVAAAAVALQVFRGGTAAYAALFGGAVALTNLLLLDWRARRANRAGAMTARQSLQVLYLSALERFVTVALLFALGIGILGLDPLALLLGFVAGLPALLLQVRPGRE